MSYISAIISRVENLIQLSDTVTGSSLSVILESLRTCKTGLEGQVDSLTIEICEALPPILHSCYASTTRLRKQVESSSDKAHTVAIFCLHVEHLVNELRKNDIFGGDPEFERISENLKSLITTLAKIGTSGTEVEIVSEEEETPVSKDEIPGEISVTTCPKQFSSLSDFPQRFSSFRSHLEPPKNDPRLPFDRAFRLKGRPSKRRLRPNRAHSRLFGTPSPEIRPNEIGKLLTPDAVILSTDSRAHVDKKLNGIDNMAKDPSNKARQKLKNLVSLDQAPSDSGYHSGFGADTESVRSLDSEGNSLGLPQDFLQDFVSYFGDTLIESTGARQWAGYAFAHHPLLEIETLLNLLLKEFTSKLQHELSFFLNSTTRYALARVIALITRYRPKISKYFCYNATSASGARSSLSTRLQGLGQQLSLSEKIRLLNEPEACNKIDLTETIPGEEAATDNNDDSEEWSVVNLELVRDLLISSDSFLQLSLKVQRTLYHDDHAAMDHILRAVVRNKLILEVVPKMYEARFDVYWSIAEFMSSQYGDDFLPVSSVVVITGSALYAQATTCGEYVLQTWPWTGLFFLEVLDNILRKTRTDIDAFKQCACFTHGELRLLITRSSNFMGANVESPPSNNGLSFLVHGLDEKLLGEFAQQLAWVGSALNISPFDDELVYCKPSIQRTAIQNYEIKFDLTPLHDSEKLACWLPLFCGAVIASGFPIPERGNELGLEIPIALLAGLAGVRHAVEYDGGVVMKGYSHVFFPVRKHGNRVQWHGIYSQNPGGRLSYQKALSHCTGRASLEEVSLDDLTSCRAIIGWCSAAVSLLGLNSVNYENIDYSKAKEADTGVECTGATLGFQQWATASLSFRFGRKDGKCHFQRTGPLQKIITAAEETPIALYDTGEKRAWLVPASDVILHIIQHRNKLKPFKVNGKPIRIGADRATAEGSSTTDFLLENQSLLLYDGAEYRFKHCIADIWSILEFLHDQNLTRERDSSGVAIKGTLREYLYGFEFKDVVRERSVCRLKQAQLEKTNGGWPLLVRDIDALVLIADGFEDIIVPAPEGNAGLCQRWHRVPKMLDYLATSTSILKQLYDEAGCRLDRKYLTSKNQLRWHQGNSILFDACKNSRRCKCNRLQQIFPKSSVGIIQPPELIVDSGAVIFGRSTLNLVSRPRTCLAKFSSIYSQPNEPLTSTDTFLESEESSSSRSLESSGNDFEVVEFSTSSDVSSCTTLAILDDGSLKKHKLELDTNSAPDSQIHRLKRSRRAST
ncbi:hypothetical protein FQN57_001340 [Myotisia sp. PD_48]|nr:hypothetical protein FQN57_001340 [Myotisia sp. PD_48]